MRSRSKAKGPPKAIRLDAKAAKSFWEKVDRRERTECWAWLAAALPANTRHARDPDSTRDSYGVFRGLMAHRVSWALANGRDPGSNQVCHSCDNPRCVNPAHLWLGDPRTNAIDAVRKGRHGVRYYNLGRERFRPLPEDEAIAIAAMHRAGVSIPSIAKIMTWDRSRIVALLGGYSYSSVTGLPVNPLFGSRWPKKAE